MAKRMKLILNIGMHKTGSSSIQQSLKTFDDGTSIYLNAGHPNHSGLLMTMFMSEPHSYSAHRKNGRNAVEVAEIKERFSQRFFEFCTKNASKNIICSAEDIGLLSETELHKMKARLDEIFDDYLIIGYVRPPHSLLSSAFQQRVAGGISVRNVSQLYPNYRSRLEKFDTVFGQDRVKLTKFDRSVLSEGDVVLDFAQKAKLDTSKIDLKNDNSARSLETTAIAFVESRVSNENNVYRGGPAVNKTLMEILRGFGKTKLQLHRELTQPVIERHADDLSWVSTRLGMNISDIPSESPNAVKSLDDLNDIAAQHLPEVTEMLADLVKQKPVVDHVLVAECVSLARKIIKAQRRR